MEQTSLGAQAAQHDAAEDQLLGQPDEHAGDQDRQDEVAVDVVPRQPEEPQRDGDDEEHDHDLAEGALGEVLGVAPEDVPPGVGDEREQQCVADEQRDDCPPDRVVRGVDQSSYSIPELIWMLLTTTR